MTKQLAWSVCVALAACHKSPAPCPAGQVRIAGACAAASAHCSNGVQDGDETGVDCGGTCGATCAIGAACGSAADCTFGVCSTGKCAASASGPSPTGAVSATIPASGGTVSAVSDERVSVSITFPAGALTRPLQVKLTPLPTEPGQWARVKLEPAGALFSKPLSVSIQLPPEVPGAGADVYFNSAALPLLIPAARTGNTLTAQLSSFGYSSLFGAPPPRALVGITGERGAADDFVPGTFLAASPLLTIDQKLVIAQRLFDAVLANGDYKYAVGLGLFIESLRMLSGLSQEDAAKVAGFTVRLEGPSCAGLRQAMDQLRPFQAYCSPELEHYTKPVGEWARVLQALDRPAGECPPYDDHSWFDLFGSKLGQTAQNIQSDYVAYVRCDCRETPKTEWSVKQQIICPRQLAPSAAAATATDPAAQLLPDDYVYAEDMVAEMQQLSEPLLADALESRAAKPVEGAIRKKEFQLCAASGDTSDVGDLLQRVPGDPGVMQDAQFCAAKLVYSAFAKDGTPGATGAIAIAAPDGATDAATSAALEATPDGTLKLAGPLPALRCPESLDGTQPGRTESDALFVVAAGAAGPVEVARQPADVGGDLLTPALSLSMNALLQKAGQDPAHPKPLALEVWRDSPGCGGLYAATPVRLFKLSVKPPAPAMTVVVNPSTTDPNNDGVTSVKAAHNCLVRWANPAGTFDMDFTLSNGSCSSGDIPALGYGGPQSTLPLSLNVDLDNIHTAMSLASTAPEVLSFVVTGRIDTDPANHLTSMFSQIVADLTFTRPGVLTFDINTSWMTNFTGTGGGGVSISPTQASLPAQAYYRFGYTSPGTSQQPHGTLSITSPQTLRFNMQAGAGSSTAFSGTAMTLSFAPTPGGAAP